MLYFSMKDIGVVKQVSGEIKKSAVLLYILKILTKIFINFKIPFVPTNNNIKTVYCKLPVWTMIELIISG